MVEVAFNARDHQRFGIEDLRAQGFQTEVWDCSPFLQSVSDAKTPEAIAFPGYRLFRSEQEILQAVSNLPRDAVVLLYLGYEERHRPIYQALSAAGVHYGIALLNITPPLTPKWGFLYRAGRALLQPRRLAHFLTGKVAPKLAGIRPPDFVLAGCGSFSKKQYPIASETRLVWAHSFDYEMFLKLKEEPSLQACGSTVFLDQFIPFHPDNTAEGRRGQIDPVKYYRSLNKTFECIESRLGGEVVIAAHPRSDYDSRPGLFGSRRVVKGDTARLIRDCRLVLAHFSAAVNFANLFEKPVAFLDSFDAPLYGDLEMVPTMAMEFGKRPLDMDRPQTTVWETELRIDRGAYARYRERFIKPAASPDATAWQIFGDYIRALDERGACSASER